MSLEKAIETLTEAVQTLTAEIKATKVENTDAPVETKTPAKAAKAEKPAKAAPKAEPEEEDDGLGLDDDEENITQEQLTTFAKKKIAEGTDRADVKKIITKAGGDSITSLDQAQRNKVYAQLQKL